MSRGERNVVILEETVCPVRAATVRTEYKDTGKTDPAGMCLI